MKATKFSKQTEMCVTHGLFIKKQWRMTCFKKQVNIAFTGQVLDEWCSAFVTSSVSVQLFWNRNPTKPYTWTIHFMQNLDRVDFDLDKGSFRI